MEYKASCPYDGKYCEEYTKYLYSMKCLGFGFEKCINGQEMCCQNISGCWLGFAEYECKQCYRRKKYYEENDC